jgi:hypothetical protein
MKKAAKKPSNKKKVVSKSSSPPSSPSQRQTISNDTTKQDQQPTTAPSPPPKTSSSTTTQQSPPQKEYTPMQLEQAELAKQLDIYISEFQQKQLALNFQPSDRELVVLFIMHLHPRFRRFVEPAELSCTSWIEAAAFARYHCTRISAILGCERHDSDPMFTSPEARALIDSGYFVSSNSPSASMYSGATKAIQHLLKNEENKLAVAAGESTASSNSSSNVGNKTAAGTAAAAETSTSSSSSSSGAAAVVISNEENTQKEEEETLISSRSSSNKEKEKEIVMAGPSQNSWLSTLDNNAEKFKEILPELKVKEQAEKETATAVKSSSPKSLTADTSTAAATATNTVAKPNSISSTATASSAMTKSEVQARINQAVKAKKEKEKEQKEKFLYQVKSNPSNPDSICYRVPKEHGGINLTFLELTVNGKQVKGLLAKLRWGSSAMSFECVKRLGLTMKETDNFCIHTDFGYEDTIGILKLPIVHPADPTIKSEMEIQVLPLIYGGKVDLVLGADFFYFFQPTLNIKTRAIRFLDRETPYIVSKIEY